MISKYEKLKKLFFQGDYRDLLKSSVDSSDFNPMEELESLPWIIGALCFNGRQEEAEKLFLRKKLSLHAEALSACQFFLGIGFCRHGHYGKARNFFAKNLHVLRKSRVDPWVNYYATQGIAFYKYFCADFNAAKLKGEDALSTAKSLRFAYGTALSLDLVAHSMMQLGEVASGNEKFSEAIRKAEELGHGGLTHSIQLSALVYRAQFGLSPKSIIKELRNAHKNIDAQNSHGQANLLLELANQYSLRGQIQNATDALNSASTLIYQSQHRRYSHLLALRFAELGYRSGQYANALQSVRMLRPLLDPKHDRLNLIMTIGLELKLLKTLALEQLTPKLVEQLERLTQKTNRCISNNMLKRNNLGEDKIGKLFYALQHDPSMAAILKDGYFGLGFESARIQTDKQAILTDLESGGLLVLDRGEVSYLKGNLTPLTKQLLSLLCQGEKSKPELIQALWGYQYRPIHHDPLIYQAITRLRELLGPRGHWIEMGAHGYRLNPMVMLMSATQPSTPKKAIRKVEESTFMLNSRQLQLLRLFKQKEFLGIQDCLKAFKVSDMTLKRDLSLLLEQGLLVRRGRARATRYSLPPEDSI